MEKEVYLYKKLAAKKVYPVKSRKAGALPKAEQFNRVKCQNCAHYCLISPGKQGICGVRENKKGKLYSLNYGKIVACHIDPIEKKPLFHFLPGSWSLSIASAGCNFQCQNCQNWDISQGPRLYKKISGDPFSPKQIIEIAQKNKTPSISYTYTEPAIFSEFALDVMKIAKKKGIKNIWVTNGFWSKELFDLVSPYLDAVNVDLKGFSESFYAKYCKGKPQPVLDTLKRIKEKKIWLEITTLAIPTLTDSKKLFQEIANFIKKELGSEIPWHISRFSPTISWKLEHIPETPIETLQTANIIGKKAGLKYVYSGNVPGIPTEDTFCPKCQTLAIDRTNYIVSRYDKNGKCPSCGEDLNLILK